MENYTGDIAINEQIERISEVLNKASYRMLKLAGSNLSTDEKSVQAICEIKQIIGNLPIDQLLSVALIYSKSTGN